MISLNDLPSPTDSDGIKSFARTFNGYEHFGSFETCAQEAKLQKRDTFDSIRNELFFAYRAGNHTGDHNIVVAAYVELLPIFKKLIS